MAGWQPIEEVVHGLAGASGKDQGDRNGIAPDRDEVVPQQVNRAVNITAGGCGDDVHVVALPPGEMPRGADGRPALEGR
jgi:hypothetical protein